MAGRRPTEPFWVDRIRQLIADNPKASSRAIYHQLVLSPRPPSGAPAPAQRTIDDIRKKFDALPIEEQNQYQKVYWPETFESGVLPWEAAAATVELLGLYLIEGEEHRPTVRAARWFWRVTQTVPQADQRLRSAVAWALAAHEILGPLPDEAARQLEGVLSHPPSEEMLIGSPGPRAPGDGIVGSMLARVWIRLLNVSAEKQARGMRAGGEIRIEDKEETDRLIAAVHAFAPYPGFWKVAGTTVQQQALASWAEQEARAIQEADTSTESDLDLR